MDTALSQFGRLDFAVNVTSGSALGGFAYFSAYCAVKHAAAGRTRSAAVEYADKGVWVNSVAPGAIATPMPQRNPAEITEPIRTSIPMQRSGRWMKSRRRVPERNMTAIRRCIESIAPDVGPVGLVECYNKVKGAASDSDAAPSRLFESGTVIRLLQLR